MAPLPGWPGLLLAAIGANAAGRGIVCPAEQGGEATWAGDIDVLAQVSLLSLVNQVKGTQVLTCPEPALAVDDTPIPDLPDVKGQESAKRALEIAAAGGHKGLSGSGKSMLAARLPGLLSPLTLVEALEASMIHSVAGQLEGGRLLMRRAFRDPHHSATLPALIGGGLRARPGEASFAHNGVLFLDELPEFDRRTLEALRQPLESGRAVVARTNAEVIYPAWFLLISAMNPYKCGYLVNPALACGRAPRCAADYQYTISGPLFYRIDLHLDVPAVRPADLALPAPTESTADIAVRVAAARAV
jgi:magnesium chelatase family protein